jgi:hypothetical protein
MCLTTQITGVCYHKCFVQVAGGGWVVAREQSLSLAGILLQPPDLPISVVVEL